MVRRRGKKADCESSEAETGGADRHPEQSRDGALRGPDPGGAKGLSVLPRRPVRGTAKHALGRYRCRRTGQARQRAPSQQGPDPGFVPGKAQPSLEEARHVQELVPDDHGPGHAATGRKGSPERRAQRRWTGSAWQADRPSHGEFTPYCNSYRRRSRHTRCSSNLVAGRGRNWSGWALPSRRATPIPAHPPRPPRTGSTTPWLRQPGVPAGSSRRQVGQRLGRCRRSPGRALRRRPQAALTGHRYAQAP